MIGVMATSHAAGARTPTAGVQPSITPPGVTWRVAADRIERERIARGWTREQLAKAARIDAKTLRDMLNARRRPTLGTLVEVARALERPLTELMTITEPSRSMLATAAPAVALTLPLDT